MIAGGSGGVCRGPRAVAYPSPNPNPRVALTPTLTLTLTLTLTRCVPGATLSGVVVTAAAFGSSGGTTYELTARLVVALALALALVRTGTYTYLPTYQLLTY